MRAEKIEKAAEALDVELEGWFGSPPRPDAMAWIALRAALSLPLDPAPGMEEVERLLGEYRDSIDIMWREARTQPHDDARAALLAAIRALPPDPAPGMEEIERLVDALVIDVWRAGRNGGHWYGTDEEARAALLAAIRALAAPGPDRYADGWRACAQAAATLVDRWHISKGGFSELAHQIRALAVPEPAPAAPSIGSDMQAAIVCPRCGIQNWDPRAAGVHARWCDSLGSAPAATGDVVLDGGCATCGCQRTTHPVQWMTPRGERQECLAWRAPHAGEKEIGT